ncbi:MAG TPA: DUF4825 domain-containing protein [Planococcus sp. (in: firmicutes)]|nr:DUF4825 domain-containing protein [Planococcus sp. (in: firmicutes)]
MRWKKGMAIVAALMLSACSAEAGTEITTIGTVKENALAELSATYIGDNSRVLGIVQELPGAETLKELDLRGEKVRITYGAKKGSLPQGDILAYWFDDNKAMEKNFLYNAFYLSLLVPNSRSYAFRIDDFSFEIERMEMVGILSEEFRDFPAGDEGWNQEVVEGFIENNRRGIEEWVESGAVRKKFFSEHPVIYISN